MQNDLNRRRRLAGLGLIALALAALSPLGAWAQNTVCAVVKLQLGQQAALEREAFNASLGLTNNLGDLPLSQLRIDVLITDPNGNSANGLFFIKTTNLQNVNAIDGTGTVQPAGSASANWLIIPSTGAGGSGTSGIKYNVTARMSFYTGGVPRITTTFPVAITVKPQPVIFLQYALPFEIFGPQPLLPGVVIATEPFPLGLRVVNVGSGTANNFSVDSAQPQIVDNAQGLAINFNLLGSYLGSTALTSNSLNIVYGDVQPGGSKQAAWIMASSFAGRFIDFTADFTHAATLGGALTSLIQGVSTYTLIKDVQDDNPGRDAQFDFLINASVPRDQLEQNYEAGLDPLPAPEFIMESDLAAMTPVMDVPGVSSGSLSGSNAVLGFAFAVPVPTATWVHAAIPFSLGGSVTALSAIRSDGKALNPHNFWISKHFNKSSLTFSYKLHVLDFTSAQAGAQSYALTFGATSLDAPPDPIANLSAAAAAPGSVNLAWNATGEDGSTGTIVGGKYAVFASTDLSAMPSVAGSSVVFSTSTPALAAQGLTLNGLLGNATYQIAVFTADAAGHYAQGANVVLAYTLAVPPAVAASSVTTSGFALSWSTAVNVAGAQYRLQLSTAPGAVAADTSYTVDASSALFTSLNPNQSYLVTALMETSTGTPSAPVAVATVTTLAVPPSTASTPFVGISSAALTAQWQYGSDPGDTEFMVELSTAPDLIPPTFSSGWIRAASFTFAGLSSQITYSARVKARNHDRLETAYAELGTAQTSAFAITPESGSAGSAFTLAGSAFGPFAGANTRVRFGAGGPVAAVSSWNNARITGTVPSLSSGTYTVFVERQNGASVTTLTGGTFTLLSAPATGTLLTLSPADGDQIAASTPTITAFYSAALAIDTTTVRLTLDGAPAAALVTASAASFVPVAALSEGTHTVTAGVADLGANVTTATATFLVDTVDPVTTLSLDGLASSATAFNAISTDVFSLAAADAGSGAAGVELFVDVDPNECDLDVFIATAPAGSCANPFYAAPFSLAPGAHTISYFSFDGAGNVEGLNQAAVVVSAPLAPILTLTPADGDTVATASPAIVAAYAPGSAALSTATFRLRLDGVDVTAQTVVTASSASFVPVAALADGTHTAVATVADVLDDASTSTSTFLVDTTPPVTTLLIDSRTFAAGPFVISSTDTLSLTAADAGSGVADIFYVIDVDPFSPACEAVPVSTGAPSGTCANEAYNGPFTLSIGTHTVYSFAEDYAGNQETVNVSSFTVQTAAGDLLPPRTTLNVGEPSYASSTLYAAASTTFTLTAVDDRVSTGDAAGLGVARTFLAVDMAPFSVYSGTFSLVSAVWTLPVCATGECTNTEAFLASGNISLAEQNWQYGCFTRNESGWCQEAVNYYCQGGGSGALAGFCSYASSWGVNPAPPPAQQMPGTVVQGEGVHTVSFYSVDLASNTEAVNTLSVAVDLTSPQTTLQALGSSAIDAQGRLAISTRMPVQLSAADPVSHGVASDVSAIYYVVDTDPASPGCEGTPEDATQPPGTCANELYVSSFTLSFGTHTVYYFAVDNAGNTESENVAPIAVNASGISISWTGSAGDGQWNTAGNWSPARIPDGTDAVSIAFSGTVAAANSAISFQSLSLGDPAGGSSPTLVISTSIANGGVATIQPHAILVQSSRSPLSFVGLDVKPGGTLTHTRNTTSYAYALDLNVSGQLTIESGAAVTLAGAGFSGGQNGTNGFGPGAGYGFNGCGGGAAHAAYGGNSCNGAQSGALYDDWTNPTMPGSGGGSGGTPGAAGGGSGGGVLIVNAGTLTLDGTVDASGTSGSSGGGSGGTINITATNLLGSGILRAAGGNGGEQEGGGAGGAIRVISSVSDISNLVFDASGGSQGAPNPCCGGQSGAGGTAKGTCSLSSSQD